VEGKEEHSAARALAGTMMRGARHDRGQRGGRDLFKAAVLDYLPVHAAINQPH
jgi:hypothetical protein